MLQEARIEITPDPRQAAKNKSMEYMRELYSHLGWTKPRDVRPSYMETAASRPDFATKKPRIVLLRRAVSLQLRISCDVVVDRLFALCINYVN